MKLLETLLGEKKNPPPCWFMRQAGRYLPEYREIREKAGSFWDLCFSTDLAAEVTLQPVNRFDVDAAIIFSDILVIPLALGQKVTFAPNHGPLLDSLNWSEFLKQAPAKINLESLAPSYAAISKVRKELACEKALIGFSGSPWTVATYMIDGGKEQRFKKSLDWMLDQTSPFDDLMDVLTQATIEHLSNQIQAGADVVQIFDSWAGAVPESQRQRVLIKPLETIVKALKDRHGSSPVIYFGRNVSDMYPQITQYLPNLTLGLDQGVCCDWIEENLPDSTVVQGNLSPEILLAGGDVLDQAVKKIKQTFKNRPYIFNLGHGILPSTPVEHVYQMMVAVRENY